MHASSGLSLVGNSSACVFILSKLGRNSFCGQRCLQGEGRRDILCSAPIRTLKYRCSLQARSGGPTALSPALSHGEGVRDAEQKEYLSMGEVACSGRGLSQTALPSTKSPSSSS